MIIWFEQKLSTLLLLGRNKRNPPEFSAGNVMLFYKAQRFCIKEQRHVLILSENTRNNYLHNVFTSFDVGRRDRFLVPQIHFRSVNLLDIILNPVPPIV